MSKLKRRVLRIYERKDIELLVGQQLNLQILSGRVRRSADG